jgi:ParB-like chromosome segregation protein Spo0J
MRQPKAYADCPTEVNTTPASQPPAWFITSRPIEAIQLGPRYRKDLGDLDSLVRSIKDVGLLHPLVVTPPVGVRGDCELIAGRRRLEACRQLGWTEVPVHIVDLDRLVAGEYAENIVRKDFTPAEAAEIAQAVKPMLEAKERKREGNRRGGQVAGKLLATSEKGDTRDALARHVGMSGRTLDKATVVVQAAKEDPAAFAPLAEEMDQTGNVDAAYQKVRTARPVTRPRPRGTERIGKRRSGAAAGLTKSSPRTSSTILAELPAPTRGVLADVEHRTRRRHGRASSWPTPRVPRLPDPDRRRHGEPLTMRRRSRRRRGPAGPDEPGRGRLLAVCLVDRLGLRRENHHVVPVVLGADHGYLIPADSDCHRDATARLRRTL